MENMEAANILREEMIGYSTHDADEVRAAYEKAIMLLEGREKGGWYPCDKVPAPVNTKLLLSVAGSDIISPLPGEDIITALDRTRREGLKHPRVTLGGYCDDEDDSGWVGSDGFPMIVNHDAWRPLPEGWHGEEEEENG